MRPNVLVRLATVVLVAGSVSCQGQNSNPTSPSGTPGLSDPSPAAADGSTLKVSAPTPTDPPNGATLGTDMPTLVVANSAANHSAARSTAFEYRFQVSTDPTFVTVNTGAVVSQGSGGTTSYAVMSALSAATTYSWRSRAEFTGAAGPWSEVFAFTTPAPPPPTPSPAPSPDEGPRTPDPPPGQVLPLPNLFQVVIEMAQQFPGALQNSCQDTGGTWEFMDRLVARFRQSDTRWGFNCKRGLCGDVSQDVLDYHFGAGPSDGSTDVYIIDVIVGHCNPDPKPGWTNLTQATADNGTIGRWKFPR